MLKNVSLNFGGEFLYEVENSETITLKREKNPNYIPELFSANSDGIIKNISAIIGKNGAGKSTVLRFLTESLANGQPYNRPAGILIFEDSNRNNRPYIYCTKNKSVNLPKGFDFSGHPPTPSHKIIYFNPVCDFQDLIGNNKNLINISTNSMLESDFEGYRYAYNQRSQTEIHKYRNITRQIDFLLKFKNFDFESKGIAIPEYLELNFWDNDDLTGGENELLDNISTELKVFYRKAYKKWRKERQNLNEKATSRKDKALQKEYVKIDGLLVLWKNLFYNQDRTNKNLFKGKVSESFDDRSLSFEEFTYRFFSVQNIYDSKKTIQFLNSFKELIEVADYFDSENRNPIIGVSLEKAKELTSFYQSYLNLVYSLNNLNYNKSALNFMFFSWRNLSSGEKLFIDLFARLSDQKINSNNPLLVLLDEGEVGFHLQWQKDYIKNILEIFPLIFPETKIQIILASHSPVILSDIPNYCISYLKKSGEEINSIKEDEALRKHSFGANIHDIISDAFFLEDGPVGDFAKKIINRAFKFLTSELEDFEGINSTNIENVINIVDEPLVKFKLRELYYKKMDQNGDQANIQAKIDVLQSQLNKLRGL